MQRFPCTTLAKSASRDGSKEAASYKPDEQVLHAARSGRVHLQLTRIKVRSTRGLMRYLSGVWA